MTTPSPLYTVSNTRPAWQLNWGLTLFWRTTTADSSWVAGLGSALEPDGIRILQHEFSEPGVSQLLLSTRPHVCPEVIAQRVKGRLQHIISSSSPKAFQRNFALRSIGSATRECVQRYVCSQPDHHPSADSRVDARIRELLVESHDVDLSQPHQAAHALYWYVLHLVLVREGRYREIRQSVLQAGRSALLATARKHGHRISQAAILPDHFHIVASPLPSQPPQSVALAYMNNIAFVDGMKPVLQSSYYAGTVGEYSRGVLKKSRGEPASTETSSVGAEEYDD